VKIEISDDLRLGLNDRGYLRQLLEGDVTQAYVDALNDPEVNRFLVGPRQQRQTLSTVQAFVNLNHEAANSILFGLYVDEILRGTTRLHDATENDIYLGLALFDKTIWGQGWGRLMIAAASRYAIDELGVARVKAGIEGDNVSSQKAFLAAGFECVHTAYSVKHDTCIQTWEFPGQVTNS